MRKTWDLLTALALLIGGVFGAALPAYADTFPDLGVAGPSQFAVLGSAGSTTLNNQNVTINGNQGAVFDATISNAAPSTVNGNVYLDTKSQYSGPGTVTGSFITDDTTGTQNSDHNFMTATGTVQTALDNAVTQLNGFSFPATSGDITTGRTFNATGTLTEVKVGNINLSTGENLTLNGTSSDFFVVEVTGNLTLGGNAQLALTGGITPDHVIYYFTSSTCSFNTHVGNVVNGIMLGEACNMDLDGTFNGELISDNNIKLMSDATVNQPSTVPEPATLLLFGTGLVSLGAWSRKRLLKTQAV